MKFCIKHSAFIERRITVNDEQKKDLLCDLFLVMDPKTDISQIQSRIENTKSKCPACFYKKPGNDKLVELINIQLKNKQLIEA